ncbi:Peroxisomal biogenesis factor [Komagataella phaffii CBS 7435]|uniref:Uncharacterized protein n=2 Tax=Komagataella phaffii TaxID=460519 RepID=C4QYR0_KOMPG|nr:Hypothetical protein PAS_chr1-4_0531 [Komagataella phaffii GS115]AOA60771.1 GQ67_01620T0 [Komagataella phaffii]KAI0464255.1 hypothetical protein LJB42_001861 [Komagataella kurtzmanii]CAH2447209.1 Peroxisomal biogenesis factor [Komagataella phaffii CBS 7435]AOA66550.1 GQ68_01636T0 [Komagataella phaffii GS115]CAY68384.1 Hypothetical protein PAS_chr1-4_0531 [Komagataella phaffii GS115]
MVSIGFLLRLISSQDTYQSIQSQIVSNPSKFDDTLATFQYGSLLVAGILKKVQHSKDSSAYSAKVYQSLRAIFYYFQDYRIVSRCWSLIPLLASLLRQLNSKPNISYSKLMPLAQTLSLVIFQALENYAAVLSHNFLSLPNFDLNDPKDQQYNTKVYRLSYRFWALYVILELADISRSILRPGSTATLRSSLDLAKLNPIAIRLYNNLGFLPLTFHWSTSGFLPETLIGLFGFVGSGALAYPHWVRLSKHLTSTLN